MLVLLVTLQVYEHESRGCHCCHWNTQRDALMHCWRHPATMPNRQPLCPTGTQYCITSACSLHARHAGLYAVPAKCCLLPKQHVAHDTAAHCRHASDTAHAAIRAQHGGCGRRSRAPADAVIAAATSGAAARQLGSGPQHRAGPAPAGGWLRQVSCWCHMPGWGPFGLH